MLSTLSTQRKRRRDAVINAIDKDKLVKRQRLDESGNSADTSSSEVGVSMLNIKLTSAGNYMYF